MSKYTTTVTVEAWQFLLGENFPPHVEPVWVDAFETERVLCTAGATPRQIANMAFGFWDGFKWKVITHGDWVVLGVTGQYFLCKNEDFEKTYTKVSE